MRWRQCGCGCGCRRCCPRLVAGISTRTFSSGLSSSSKLAKLESEDKLLSDAELWLEEFESDLGRHPLSQLRLTPRRKATPRDPQPLPYPNLPCIPICHDASRAVSSGI